jgi:hypothetical protein
VGQQVVERCGGVKSDPAEDVGQIRNRFDAVRLAGGGERVEAGDIVAGLLVADKEEILAAEGDDSEGGLASASAHAGLTKRG